MNTYHKPVLINETIEYLNIQKGKKYIDATLGGGGHTVEILKKGGSVLGIDQDQDALRFVQANYESSINDYSLKLVKGNFKEIKELAYKEGFTAVNGVLFDLGVSSYQFDKAERGFSFKKEGPLDMRMDQAQTISARDIIAVLSKKELEELFIRLGEEYKARRIAERIVEARKNFPITTTKQLADIVAGREGGFYRIHPATKVFQALRIAVNDELNAVSIALPQAIDLLTDQGRLIVISFHSLEDRIVKHTFLDWQKKGKGKVITKKPIEASLEEQQKNKRSRSAKLRVFQKKEYYD